MFKKLVRKIDDLKCKMYLKRMKKRHDEFENNTLDFDYSLQIAFNTELRVRELVYAKRRAQAKLVEFMNDEPVDVCELINYTGNNDLQDIDDTKLIITDEERKLSLAHILVGIDDGKFDEITLERVEQ